MCRRRCWVAFLLLMWSVCACAAGGTARVAGGGRNTLTVENGTGELALVRIKSPTGVTMAQLEIRPGGSASCRLPDGRFREVVRFGATPSAYRFAKGEGFELRPRAGGTISARLTLHGVVNGNYSTQRATAADFQ